MMPDPNPTPPTILSRLQAETRYGAISNGVWGAERSWCELVEIPQHLRSSLIHWLNTAAGTAMSHIYMNRDMREGFLAALEEVVAQGLAPDLHTFDGCFAVRDSRGLPGQLSAHAYACAIDINAHENPLGAEGTISSTLAACFTRQGFTWGRTFKRPDTMHFSWLGY